MLKSPRCDGHIDGLQARETGAADVAGAELIIDVPPQQLVRPDVVASTKDGTGLENRVGRVRVWRHRKLSISS